VAVQVAVTVPPVIQLHVARKGTDVCAGPDTLRSVNTTFPAAFAFAVLVPDKDKEGLAPAPRVMVQGKLSRLVNCPALVKNCSVGLGTIGRTKL